jgi:hypothetical protein
MTLSSMRGRRKPILARGGGRSSAEDADRGAMAGGGRGRGLTTHETKPDIEMSGSRKRKRGQNSSEIEGDQMSLDQTNGNDERLSDEALPELGIKDFHFLADMSRFK